MQYTITDFLENVKGETLTVFHPASCVLGMFCSCKSKIRQIIEAMRITNHSKPGVLYIDILKDIQPHNNFNDFL